MFEEVEKPTPGDEGASNQNPDDESIFSEGSDNTDTDESRNEEGEAEDADAPDGDASEDQNQPTYELSNIAKVLGLDEDDLDVDDDGQVVFNAKIDGISSKAKIKDSLATYQKQGHLDNKLRDVNVREANLKSQQEKFTQDTTAKLQQIEDLGAIALQELQKEYNQVDWNELRLIDPGEFSAKQVEFNNRNNTIQQSLQSTAKQRQDKVHANLAKEHERLTVLIPEWSDPDVAKKEKSELSGYLRENNINPEIGNYADGMLLLRKAKAFDDLNKRKPVIKKLVKKAAKVVKPSVSKKVNKPKSDAELFYG